MTGGERDSKSLGVEGRKKEDEAIRAESSELDDPRMQRVHDQLLREKSEPNELGRPMPIWLVAVCGVVVAWGAFYFGNTYSNFRSDVFDPNYRGGAPVQSEPKEFDPIARGQRVFRNNCASCHQADGSGVPGVYPPLVDSKWVAGPADRSIHILLAGLIGEIEVKGNSYNGNMPAFAGILGDRDIAAVLSYVRTEWNGASMVEESEVAALRAESRSSPWTGPELLESYPLE
jgi:mono/diheme cytochrome c family protein